MSQEEANQIVREEARRRRMLRPPMKVLLPTAAALGAGAAIAVAAIPGSDGVIHGCYLTNTVPSKGTIRPGALRVIDQSLPTTTVIPGGGTVTNFAAVCDSDEAPITWNQQGPQGPPGVPGTPGTPGGTGAPGADGTNLVGQTSFGVSGGGKTFLKIEGIKGESKDKLHPDEIELDSVAFTVGGTGGHGFGSGGGEGKVAVHDISFTHKIDKASPVLFQAAATGKNFSKGFISFAKLHKGKETDYLVFKLTNVLVSSLSQGTNGHGTPTESVTLNFAKVQETYYTTNASGKTIGSVTVNVNINSSAKVR